MIPSHLAAGQVVREHPVTGRWFITIGMPGFNLPANNRDGYATRSKAIAAHIQCGGKGDLEMIRHKTGLIEFV